jgi:hypothetical protein
MSHFHEAMHPDDLPPWCQGEPIEDEPEELDEVEDDDADESGD